MRQTEFNPDADRPLCRCGEQMQRVGAHPDSPPLYVCWELNCPHRGARRTLEEITSPWPGGDVKGIPLFNDENRAAYDALAAKVAS